MELFINNKSGAPIYDQIYNQIKQQIISGALQPDEAMPSIRGLARDLRISVITTKRAYDELEKEGFLYAVPAKGFFVAPKNTELLREEWSSCRCRKQKAPVPSWGRRHSWQC